MSDDPSPKSPWSIAESAIALHEFYSSLVEAGFDQGQALFLTAQVIAAGKGGGT